MIRAASPIALAPATQPVAIVFDGPGRRDGSTRERRQGSECAGTKGGNSSVAAARMNAGVSKVSPTSTAIVLHVRPSSSASAFSMPTPRMIEPRRFGARGVKRSAHRHTPVRPPQTRAAPGGPSSSASAAARRTLRREVLHFGGMAGAPFGLESGDRADPDRPSSSACHDVSASAPRASSRPLPSRQCVWQTSFECECPISQTDVEFQADEPVPLQHPARRIHDFRLHRELQRRVDPDRHAPRPFHAE